MEHADWRMQAACLLGLFADVLCRISGFFLPTDRPTGVAESTDAGMAHVFTTVQKLPLCCLRLFFFLFLLSFELRVKGRTMYHIFREFGRALKRIKTIHIGKYDIKACT